MTAIRSGTHRTAMAAAGVLAATTIGGCSLFGDAVQQQWEDRPSLASCGRVDLGVGEQLEDTSRTQVDCLTTALASGAGGELVVTFVTTEGDPITEYLRVTRARTTEVYIDASKDRFSDGKWSYAACPNPTSALDTSC